MQLYFLKILFLPIFLFSAFCVQAQEVLDDSVFVNSAMQNNMSVQFDMENPYFGFSMPLLPGRDSIRLMKNGQENIASMQRSLTQRAALFSETDLTESGPKFPGLADYKNDGGTLGGFKLLQDWGLSYGAFFSKQYDYHLSAKQIVLGANLLLEYQLSDRLRFLIEGQYVTEGDDNSPIFKESTLFPTSHVATGFRYKAGKQSGISLGIEYQYNRQEKRWKPESGGKMLLKF